MYEVALKIGKMCMYGSLLLHTAAGLIPMDAQIRAELRTCTKESGNAGLLFLFLAWIYGVGMGVYECAGALQQFAYWFVAVFLILVVGGALLSRWHSMEDREVCRRLKRSALMYGIVCYLLAVLLG